MWSPYPRSRKKVLLKLVEYNTFSCLWFSCFLNLSWYFICYLMFHSLRHGDSQQLSADLHRHLRSHSTTCQVLKQHPAAGISFLPPKHRAKAGGRRVILPFLQAHLSNSQCTVDAQQIPTYASNVLSTGMGAAKVMPTLPGMGAAMPPHSPQLGSYYACT